MCPHLNNFELAAALGRTPKAVRMALGRQKIRRPDEAITAHARRRWLGEANPNWKGGISYDPAAWQREQKRRHSAQVRARAAVYRAVRSGRLERQPCEVCGVETAQAHHDDYSNPLGVRWLCRKHHRAVHTGDML